MKFGPMFFAELASAGCSDGVAISHNPDDTDDSRVIYAADLSDAYKARVEAVIAAHDPTKQLPEPVPDETSRRQFFMQNVAEGVISEAEAVAAMAGTLPAAFEAMVEKLPAEQQFPARMALAGQTFLRSSPFTAVFGALRDPPMTSDQLDASWRAASKL